MAAGSGSGEKPSKKKSEKVTARAKRSRRPRGSSKKHSSSWAEPVEYTYRGKAITHEPPDEEGRAGRLTVDGRPVRYERTDEGVTSHAFMYMVFGSPFELAEELIRQWGEAEVDPAVSDSAHDHHDHSHGSEG